MCQGIYAVIVVTNPYPTPTPCLAGLASVYSQTSRFTLLIVVHHTNPSTFNPHGYFPFILKPFKSNKVHMLPFGVAGRTDP